MRAFVVKQHAHPSKISLSNDAPEPEPAEDEVLVEVFSAGLNYFDVRLSPHPFILRPHVRLRTVDPAVSGQVPGQTPAPVHARLRVCGADRGGLTHPEGVSVQAWRQGLRRSAGRVCGQAHVEVEGAAPAV